MTQVKQRKGWRMSCDVALLILQAFRHFTYVTAHSPTLPSIYLRHSSFSNPSVALPTSQLIVHPFHCFTYFTAHSPTLPTLYLRHSSFSNPSVTSPTSQFILQPFFRFSYVTSSSLNSPGEPPMARSYRSYLCLVKLSTLVPDVGRQVGRVGLRFMALLTSQVIVPLSTVSVKSPTNFAGPTALLPFPRKSYSGFLRS